MTAIYWSWFWPLQSYLLGHEIWRVTCCVTLGKLLNHFGPWFLYNTAIIVPKVVSGIKENNGGVALSTVLAHTYAHAPIKVSAG